MSTALSYGTVRFRKACVNSVRSWTICTQIDSNRRGSVKESAPISATQPNPRPLDQLVMTRSFTGMQFERQACSRISPVR